MSDVYDNYNIVDGDDPLASLIDVDISKMSPDQLKIHLVKLREAKENPKALKKIVSKGSKKTTTDVKSILASLGL